VAVDAFLQGRIGFDHIPGIIGEVLSATKAGKLESIKQVLESDFQARDLARERVERYAGRRTALRPVSSGSRLD
jgi:1-deoxy-D-xylulose 5-phosphate reductoisomerase